jgi:probable rRNA maturation factor
MNVSRSAASRMPTCDIVIESPLWDAEPQAIDTINAAIVEAARAVESEGEIAIALVDDQAMRALNRQWRDQDKPTNVLSFPAAPGVADGAVAHLGDIVIAFETTVQEARAENRPFAHHLAHLAVHGYLHLLGYDHETEQDAEVMEGLESAILDRLGVPDPYARATP